MTRRERLEGKLERRKEWAEKAAKRADARFGAASSAIAGIPPGQPILIGHHSERGHRRALGRHDGNMRAGIEEQDKAQQHNEKARGLGRQLKNSVFSDDPDAVEQLQARIADLEALADKEKAINAAWRKAKGAATWADSLGLTAEELRKHNRTMAICPYLKGPCFSTNTRANARRLKKRIEAIQGQAQRQAETEAAGGILIKDYPEGYCGVRFAEKPDYAVRQSLKDAGFWWSCGEWQGKADKLPASVAGVIDER